MTKNKKILIMIAVITAILVTGIVVTVIKYNAKQQPVPQTPVLTDDTVDIPDILTEDLPDGKKLIEELQKKYRTAKTFKTTWKSSYSLNSSEGKSQTQNTMNNSVSFKRPNKLVLVTDKVHTYIDGKKFVMYSADANFYRIQAFKPDMLKALSPEDGGIKVIGLLLGVDFVKNIEKYDPVKSEMINGKEMYVVTFTVKSPKSVKMTQTLWIVPDTLEIYRNDITTVQTLKTQSFTQKTSSIAPSSEFDKEIKDSVFKFTPPAGAQSMDDVEIPKEPMADVAPAVPESAPKPVIMEGKAAPDFSYKDATGVSKMMSQNSDKVVVLNFWAMPTCENQLPVLQALNDKYSGRVEFIFINLNNDNDKIKALVDKNGMNFPIVFANESIAEAASKKYHLAMVPTMYIIGSDGIIKKQFMGFTDSSVISAAIDSLLAPIDTAPAQNVTE